MSLIFQVHSRITDANGDAVNAGARYIYAQGTTTLSTIYSDVTLLTTQTNPVTADSGGKLARIFVPAGSYRVVDKDAVDGTTLFDADDVIIEDQTGTKGANVASAAAISLGAGQYFHITGTTTITDVDFASPQNGRWAVLEFDGILTFTHNATTLKLPGAANITTAAGDTCMVIQDSGDNMRCAWYQRAATLSAPTAASTTEALTGTDTSKHITADALAAFWEKGSNIASAATISVGEGGVFHITGTTTITDIDFSPAVNGRLAWLIFDDALTLTHNATTLLLPGGANKTTAANDRALFVQDAGDNVICLAYIKTAADTVTETFLVSVSDETTIITTGTAKVTFRMPYAFTVTAVRASLTTASSSGLPTFDINEAGVSILSTKLTIDANETTSTTAATAAVISDTSLADAAEMTIDIDTAGTGAKGAKVYILGRQT